MVYVKGQPYLCIPYKLHNLFNIWHKIHLVILLLRFVSISAVLCINVLVCVESESSSTRVKYDEASGTAM